jgi:hypothetical protein
MYIVKILYSNNLLLHSVNTEEFFFPYPQSIRNEYLDLCRDFQEYEDLNLETTFTQDEYDSFISFYTDLKSIITSDLGKKIKTQLISNLKFYSFDDIVFYLRTQNDFKKYNFTKKAPKIKKAIDYINDNIKIKDLDLSNTQQSFKINFYSFRNEFSYSKFDYKKDYTNKILYEQRGLFSKYGYEKYKYFWLYYFIPDCKNIEEGFKIITADIFEDRIPLEGRIIKIDKKNVKINGHEEANKDFITLMIGGEDFSEYAQKKYKNLCKKDSIYYKMAGISLVIVFVLFLINQKIQILPIKSTSSKEKSINAIKILPIKSTSSKEKSINAIKILPIKSTSSKEKSINVIKKFN